MAQTLRVTREYFLSDVDLRALLKLPPSAIILAVERKGGTYKGRGRDDQSIDLQGCVVTTFDTREATNG